jgi:DNA-binding NarL/FixJ family response regulator
MKSQYLRVLLADDHDVVRTGVRVMLEARDGWQVCCEAGNGKDAVKLADEMKPDIAILDLEMSGLDGISATRQIKQRQPQIKILIFTMFDDEYRIREVLAAGASAFVLKSEGGRKLIQAVETLSEQRSFLTGRTSETLQNRFVTSETTVAAPSPLTRRQREIVRLLATGKSNKEVATALGISSKTVETHRAAIMRKLGLRSIAALVRYAVREHVIKA